MFPEGGNLGLVLPNDLSQWTTDKVRKEGVKVYPGTFISKATVEEEKVKVTLTNGEEVCRYFITAYIPTYTQPPPPTHTHITHTHTHTHTHTQLIADHVLVAVGLEPNTQLAKSSRLEIDSELGGYRVNAELQACSDIWVVSWSSV